MATYAAYRDVFNPRAKQAVPEAAADMDKLIECGKSTPNQPSAYENPQWAWDTINRVDEMAKAHGFNTGESESLGTAVMMNARFGDVPSYGGLQALSKKYGHSQAKSYLDQMNNGYHEANHPAFDGAVKGFSEPYTAIDTAAYNAYMAKFNEYNKTWHEAFQACAEGRTLNDESPALPKSDVWTGDDEVNDPLHGFDNAGEAIKRGETGAASSFLGQGFQAIWHFFTGLLMMPFLPILELFLGTSPDRGSSSLS
ncbi:hypothetical protein [Corynebacterium cystitidis]|nr:hypothetical protein [Corynebacterium cystitidis]